MLTKLRVHRGREDTGRIVNLRAYAARLAATELVELQRAHNVSLGFPAKPGRKDGIPGRIANELTRHPDGQWLTHLFRIMASYPFSAHHIPGRWPLEGFLEEFRAKRPHEEATVETMRHDVNRVLDVATATAGSVWVYHNLTLPLNANCVPEELTPESATAEDDLYQVLGGLLRKAYQRNRTRGISPVESFRCAAAELTGAAPSEGPDPEALRAIDELEFATSRVTARPRSSLRVPRESTAQQAAGV